MLIKWRERDEGDEKMDELNTEVSINESEIVEGEQSQKI